MTSRTLACLLMLALTGCAKINDAGMRLLSSSAPAVAVVNDTLLTGTALVFTDRTGTLKLESSLDPKMKCLGQMRYTATQTGMVSLKCSQGTEAHLTFTATHETRGYGTGTTGKGPASFTFGMEPGDAAAYLMLPAGKRIMLTPDGTPQLESIEGQRH